ncbi:hypothetical protein E2C01_033835 [Portunus trituberculatus]|uniref:Uncharacterized protein n=1 Tax=Portunus trituberculatus TaxID=210409 RepID=A0A5B7F4T7_PORTR|nr:hypothetical protein [Portunus trituberculatus]
MVAVLVVAYKLPCTGHALQDESGRSRLKRDRGQVIHKEYTAHCTDGKLAGLPRVIGGSKMNRRSIGNHKKGYG